jgi:hypothetical protein
MHSLKIYGYTEKGIHSENNNSNEIYGYTDAD